jgi:hypothetical protein
VNRLYIDFGLALYKAFSIGKVSDSLFAAGNAMRFLTEVEKQYGNKIATEGMVSSYNIMIFKFILIRR